MVKSKAPASLAAALTLAACAGAPADDEGVATVRSRQNGGCPAVLCGDNNGAGTRAPFYELDASGAQLNAAGWRIVEAFDRHINPMTIRVDHDRLIGQPLGGAMIEGDDLVGSVIRVVKGDGRLGQSTITIDGYQLVDFWTAPDDQSRVPLYHFTYTPEYPKDAPVALCRNTLSEPEFSAIEGQAVVFAGDRYDADTLKVTETSVEGPWFNIGCPGTGAMKMHLFRHTLAGATKDVTTTVPQRQALLRMFAADYCGTGRNFTADGQRIAFNYDQEWLSDAERIDFRGHGYASEEAIWQENGAACLDTPRRAAVDPNIAAEINAECAAVGHALPPCEPSAFEDWSQRGYAVTVNPGTPP